eukprot:scaffold3508_cov113-Cylindrotheca_fusiformis.AAC.1
MATMQYKAGLVGGWSEAEFDSIVTSYSQRIKNDSSLSPFFGDLDMEGLKQFQTELLLAAFLAEADDSTYFRFCRLVSEGLDDSHFNSLLHHLNLAFADSSVEAQVFETCKTHLTETKDNCDKGSPPPKSKKTRSSHGVCPMCVLRPSTEKKERKRKRIFRSLFRIKR